MTPPLPSGDVPPTLRLAELTPWLSITVLRCTSDDPLAAFDSLVRFLRGCARESGRAIAVRIRAEVRHHRSDVVDELGVLSELGLDDLYGCTREVRRPPGWSPRDSDYTDVTNELTLAVRRDDLVAVSAGVPSEAQYRRWIRQAAPFIFLPPDVLAGTFRGDGRMLWMSGVHRRRANKADSKTLGGIRLQEALHSGEDGSYAARSMKIDLQPEDDASVLRELLTVSPEKSHISWKRPLNFPVFVAATVEALDLVAKALVAPDDPEPLFPQLAVVERDLGRVRGAFDVTVADPDVLRGDPDADEERVERAESLLDALVEVRGDPASAVAEVDVGRGGAVAGTLTIRPVEEKGMVRLDVRIRGPVTHDAVLREVKDAIGDGDVLTVHYQSGHMFDGHRVSRQRLVHRPFPDIEFADFTGFDVAREKPRQQPGQSLHEAIGGKGDDSLFAWVVRRYSTGWLLCDDGAGEVADFLHLADDGTLTVIHVKAAASRSAGRRIAAARFEQVVSQAAKNVHYLDNDTLVERLSGNRVTGAAAWYAGRRAVGTDFVERLRTRVASDRTFVAIVQPHLLKSVHDAARAAADAGRPDHNAGSLMLLDNLLHSTRRTVGAVGDGLRLVGCADSG